LAQRTYCVSLGSLDVVLHPTSLVSFSYQQRKEEELVVSYEGYTGIGRQLKGWRPLKVSRSQVCPVEGEFSDCSFDKWLAGKFGGSNMTPSRTIVIVREQQCHRHSYVFVSWGDQVRALGLHHSGSISIGEKWKALAIHL